MEHQNVPPRPALELTPEASAAITEMVHIATGLAQGDQASLPQYRDQAFDIWQRNNSELFRRRRSLYPSVDRMRENLGERLVALSRAAPPTRQPNRPVLVRPSQARERLNHEQDAIAYAAQAASSFWRMAVPELTASLSHAENPDSEPEVEDTEPPTIQSVPIDNPRRKILRRRRQQ